MKARLESGKVVKYNTIPKILKSASGETILKANTLPEFKLKQLGFHNVVTPSYDLLIQELGDIYFDSVNNEFTYPVNNLTWSETLSELKEAKIKIAKDSANQKLITTDWYVVRKQEKEIDIPAQIQTDRDAIRTACTAHENAINAKTTKSQVQSYNITY